MTASRIALVTGAGAGIGLATSRAFAAAGYAVVLSDLDAASLPRPAAAALRDEGHDATGVRCDIASPDEVDALLRAVDEQHGRLDALHANAGYSAYKLLEDMSVDEIRHQLDVNLFGHLLVVRAAIGLLARSGGGSIVFTSSVQGHITLPGCAPYAAAKAGLMAVARALSVELGDRGIRVNTVSPGTIDTPMLQRDLSGMNTAETAAFWSASTAPTPSAGSATRGRSPTWSSSSARTAPATSRAPTCRSTAASCA